LSVQSRFARTRLCCLAVISSICFLAAFFCACQEQITFPAPVIGSLSPTFVEAGQPAFSLTVEGKHFTPSSTVLWNGSARTSFYNSTTGALSAEILATDIAIPGQALISVTTPQPGGGTTTTLTFDITANPSDIPKITGLNPATAMAGSGSFSLTVIGQNFNVLSTVSVNGSTRTTTFVSSTSLQIAMTAGDDANAGAVQIAVFNPPPEGGSSNIFPLNVNNPLPTVTTLSPTAGTAGTTTSTTVTLTGTGYVSTSVVLVNGSPHTTAFDSATQVEVTLAPADQVNGGVDQIQVSNPTPGGGVSNIVTFGVDPTDLFGLPLLVDIAPNGTQANNGICGSVPTCSASTPSLSTAGPSVSGTGQFVAFASNSTNLVLNASNNPITNASEVYVRNTCLAGSTTTGTATTSACAPQTVLSNIGVGGDPPNGPSQSPSIDSSGTHVAYSSTATNLVSYAAVSGAASQVYWQLTCTTGITTGTSTSTATGCTTSTTNGTAALVSVAADGVTPGNGNSYDPVISADGQYVAFVSLATNLVSNPGIDGVTPQVYIRNTCDFVPPSGTSTSSCTPTTYLVSVSPSDGITPGNGASSNPAIADEGLFVSFTSTATNLASSSSSLNGTSQVFERSTCITTIGVAGNTCAPSTNLISSPDATLDAQTPSDGASDESAISEDGRFVAFVSPSTNLIVGVGPTQQVYMRDTCTGVAATTPPTCTPSLVLISTPDGTTPANGLSEDPSFSSCTSSTTTVTTATGTCATGQFVAFATRASNLGANVQNGVENIFVRNTCLGLAVTTSTTPTCAQYTFLASQPAGASLGLANGDSIEPSISGDGHTVGYISSASNLVATDSNGIPDVFLGAASPTFVVTVSLMGSGTSGTVTDNQAQINCVLTLGVETGTCTGTYPYGISLTLSATASSGFQFTGWGGSVNSTECPTTTPTTTGSCTVTLISTNNITATFSK
jgi:hypothetical protein